ncbi:MAG: hypothetical protein ACTTJV_08845 [Ottowia sp.]
MNIKGICKIPLKRLHPAAKPPCGKGAGRGADYNRPPFAADAAPEKKPTPIQAARRFFHERAQRLIFVP